MSKKAFAIAVQTGLPVMLWGFPGTAKTQFSYSLAEVTHRHLEVLIGSTREPADFSGLPIIANSNNGDMPEVYQAPLGWAKRLIKAGGSAMLFLDEATCLPPAVAAVMLRVLTDKIVGEANLHPNTWLALAGNPPECSAGGMDFPPPMANRIVHIEWKLPVKDWCNGMILGFPPPTDIPILPNDWTINIPKHRALVASYISCQPQKMLIYPKNESETGKAWPSPRSWTMLATLMAACASIGIGMDTQLELAAGCVGEGPASEYLNWLKDIDLPNPEEVLNDFSLLNPTLKNKRNDKIHAVLSSIVSYVLQDNAIDKWSTAFELMEYASKTHKDIACNSAFLLSRNTPKGYKGYPKNAKVFYDLMNKAGLIDL